MNLIDSFYTPSELAKRLISYIGNRNIKTIADFCVGDGELLRAAMEKWPNAIYHGIDISKEAVSSVKSLHKDWKISRCDFINKKSRTKCKILKSNIVGFDLILLNPPFSCIGGSIYEVTFGDKLFKVSTSMKFLAESLKYLKKNGCLYAIMPISSAYSQKDKKLWNYLEEKFKLTIIDIPDGNHFANCSASVLFISLNDNPISNYSKEFSKMDLKSNRISIFRGKVSMHKVKKKEMDGKYLIHTTNLKNNNLENLNIRVKKESSEIKGPAVLIPRVGKPSSKKIATISKGSSYVLSDCILAINTNTNKDAKYIKDILINNWENVEILYKGTGASYITIERLANFLGLSQFPSN